MTAVFAGTPLQSLLSVAQGRSLAIKFVAAEALACWKETYILKIHARKLCQSQHYYIQFCLEKERKTDVHVRSRSHELRKKPHNVFKLD